MKHLWHYGYKSWDPEWWYYIFPYRGEDEYGRRTLVIPIHPFGFLVWAFRTCYCPECSEIREQTARWEAEGGDE